MFFFVLAGRRPYSKVVDEGSFHCPRCRRRRKYRHKTSRQHFHLFFIPVAPAGQIHEFVECHSCHGTFRKEAIYYQPEHGQGSFEAIFEKAVRKVLIHMSKADAEVEEAEVVQIQEAYKKATGSDLSRAGIMMEAVKALNPWGLRRTLRRLAPMLNEEGRRVVLEAARSVAAADGFVQRDEEELLEQIAKAIGMDDTEWRRFLIGRSSSR